jgi:hypothetical protein
MRGCLRPLSTGRRVGSRGLQGSLRELAGRGPRRDAAVNFIN